jgi:hypothetical protein
MSFVLTQRTAWFETAPFDKLRAPPHHEGFCVMHLMVRSGAKRRVSNHAKPQDNVPRLPNKSGYDG